MSCTASRVAMRSPSTFVSSISRQSSVGADDTGARRPRPALFTSASTAAEAVARRRDQPHDVVLDAHVGLHDRHAVDADLLGEPLEPVHAARADREPRALGRERPRHRGADPARCAGHDHASAVEYGRHACSLRPLTCTVKSGESSRMPIDLSYIGKKLGGVTQSWNQKDVMLYALGVGCGREQLPFVYERDLKVLPTFAVVPAFPPC
jgi:hypothetical protein